MGPVLLVGKFRLPVARLAEARPILAAIIAASRAEPGCKEYAYGEDVCDPGLFRVIERWESRAALDAHFASAHMAKWRVDRAELGMTERAITIHSGGISEET